VRYCLPCLPSTPPLPSRPHHTSNNTTVTLCFRVCQRLGYMRKVVLLLVTFFAANCSTPAIVRYVQSAKAARRVSKAPSLPDSWCPQHLRCAPPRRRWKGAVLRTCWRSISLAAGRGRQFLSLQRRTPERVRRGRRRATCFRCSGFLFPSHPRHSRVQVGLLCPSSSSQSFCAGPFLCVRVPVQLHRLRIGEKGEGKAEGSPRAAAAATAAEECSLRLFSP
jgi:hypothetical protein